MNPLGSNLSRLVNNLSFNDQDIPVVKDLASHHMSTHSPTILILLLYQPSMAKHLNIEIKDLKTRMMDMELRTLEEEKCVVINPVLTSVQMHECCDILLGIGRKNQLGGFEIEVRGIELKGFLVVGDAHTEMAKFVDGGWSLLEALGSVHWSVFRSWKVVSQFWESLGDLDWCLTIYKMEGEIVNWVVECDSLSTSWSIRVVNGSCSRERCG